MHRALQQTRREEQKSLPDLCQSAWLLNAIGLNLQHRLPTGLAAPGSGPSVSVHNVLGAQTEGRGAPGRGQKLGVRGISGCGSPRVSWSTSPSRGSEWGRKRRRSELRCGRAAGDGLPSSGGRGRRHQLGCRARGAADRRGG